MLGVRGCSLNVGAGHVLTPREHVCGEYRDDFDWTTLQPHYLRRIGWKPVSESARNDGASQKTEHRALKDHPNG